MTRARPRFAPGDRVGARRDTVWDEKHNAQDSDLTRLFGHHGRVVDACDETCRNSDAVHVVWEGTHDGRSGETIYCNSDPIVWHMYGDEIEHID